MTVAQSSLFIQFFVAFWALLCRSWRESAVGRAFHRAGAAIRRSAAGSAICQFLWREGALPRAWPGSISCRFFTAVINLPCALVQWLYRKWKAVWDGSVAFRIASAVGSAGFLFLGLSMFLMLVAPHSLWNNAYALLCMYAMILIFLAGCMARPRHKLNLDRLGPYYTVFMGFICFGLVGSLSTGLSMRFFVFHVIAFLITVFTVSTVQRTEQLQLMIAVAAAGLVIAALYGCYQGYVGVPVVANQQDMALNADMPGRVYSFFDNPNNFAEILVMLMPFLLALALNSRSWGGRVLALGGMGAGLTAIGYTYSRSGWIGLALALAVFLILLNWRFLPLFLVLGVAAIPFLPESILNRILTIGNTQDTSTRYRFAIYQDTKYLIRDYGLRGVGLGSDVMRKVFTVYPTMFDGNYPIHTHNNYLQMWGELGFFGALTYLAMVLHQIKTGVKTFYACADQRLRNLLAAAVGAFCGISLISVAEYTWFYPRNMFIYFFLFGVIAACVKLARGQKNSA